jgi:hypothetical protein
MGRKGKGHRFLVGFGSICIWVAPVTVSSAQGPATPGAFDGKYVGTATVSGGKYPLTCIAIKSMDMTIASGQVVVHEVKSDGAKATLQGSVNSSGEVSVSKLPHGTAALYRERFTTRCSQVPERSQIIVITVFK